MNGNPLRLVLALVMGLAAPAAANDWVTWLACDFDDWPLTPEQEAETLQIGRLDTTRGQWTHVSGSPFPQVRPDPAGRPGKSLLLTRRPGVGIQALRAPTVQTGKMEISFRVYAPERHDTSLFFFAIPGSGRRDAALSIEAGTGRLRYHAEGEWHDTEEIVPVGRWTPLSMLLDFDQSSISIALGKDTPAVRDIPLPDGYRPNRFRFECAVAPGRVWVDDVLVRVTDPPATSGAPASPPPVLRQGATPAETARPALYDDSAPKDPLPTLDELADGLAHWAEKRPDLFTLETAGLSRGGRPVYLCRITDTRVPGAGKQRVLVTTSSGPERNATALALALMKWLLGPDELAARTREGLEVYVMPCNDPDGYGRAEASEVLGADLLWSGPRNPDRQPAAAAMMRTILDLRPEVHVDLRSHDGTRGVMVSENFGVDFESATARSYVHAVPHRMNLAAERDAGASCLAGEEGAGLVRATAPLGPGGDPHYYQRHHRVTPPLLSYHAARSIAFTAHASFRETWMAGMRELFRMGLDEQPWRMERHPGYPVNRMEVVLTGVLGAWGRTAEERRRSRVELWNKIEQITLAETGYGWIGGRALVFSSDPVQRARLTSDGGVNLSGANVCAWTRFIENLEHEPDAERFDIEAMNRMVYARHTPGNMMYMAGELSTARADDPVIRHGLSLLLYIPYPSATVTEVRLDGHRLPESDTHGYSVYHNPGTVVEVAIPPGQTRRLHVVTLLFEPDQERREGFAPEDWEF